MKNNKKSLVKKIICIVVAVTITFTILSLGYGNFYVDVEHFIVETNDLSSKSNGYKIAHISDYHNRGSELVDKQIFDALETEKPDIIVVSGDLVDTDKTNVDVAILFVENLCKFAPVYYVMGNHESNVKRADETAFNKLCVGVKKTGANLLINDKAIINLPEGDVINIYGIHDPYFYGGYEQVYQRSRALCEEFTLNPDEYNILLAHHPEPLQEYSKFDFDLVFSGHAHGGQVTLFGRAIMAPDQVYFPPYDEGLYEMNNTQLILSRGIGYSVASIRVFCNPHLIFTEIKTA